MSENKFKAKSSNKYILLDGSLYTMQIEIVNRQAYIRMNTISSLWLPGAEMITPLKLKCSKHSNNPGLQVTKAI